MIVLVIFLIYFFVLVGLALEGFTYRPLKEAADSVKPEMSFSIIVNYRNEVKHLHGLLADLVNQNYPTEKTEFILVNDGSTDHSAAIVYEFSEQNPEINFKLIERKVISESGKKDGITQALEIASHEHILCTDADCRLQKDWISSYSTFYTNHLEAHFVAGGITLGLATSWIQLLQKIEMLSLQITTIGGFHLHKPFMCNGANMSFKKRAFDKVDGYRGNDHIASGDDVFLLEKLHQLDPEKCYFNTSPNSIVSTYPKNSWKAMIAQRVRWAGKAGETKSIINKLLAFTVLVSSISFIMLPIYYLTGLIDLNILKMSIVLKFLADTLVLFLGTRKLHSQTRWLNFLLLWWIYPVLVINIAIRVLTKSKTDWQAKLTDQNKVQV